MHQSKTSDVWRDSEKQVAVLLTHHRFCIPSRWAPERRTKSMLVGNHDGRLLSRQPGAGEHLHLHMTVKPSQTVGLGPDFGCINSMRNSAIRSNLLYRRQPVSVSQADGHLHLQMITTSGQILSIGLDSATSGCICGKRMRNNLLSCLSQL